MTSKLQVVLPKDGNTYGAWISIAGKGDIHVYVDGTKVVFGHNTQEMLDGKMVVAFSNPALAFEPEGVRIQYADENGQVVTKEVSEKKVHEILLETLQKIKTLVD